MRNDIVRFCNNCSIHVEAKVSKCPSCNTDSGLSYFEGMYYETFDMLSYTKKNGKADNIEIKFQGKRKDFIEPLLDSIDREGRAEGYIITLPGGGKTVYMTPIETVREATQPKSGCIVIFAILNLGVWLLSLLIS